MTTQTQAAQETGLDGLLSRRARILPISVGVMLVVFGLVAMIAISNTTLVTVVAQSRILYGMAREDVVPAVFAKVHPTRRSPYVALLFGAGIVGLLLLIGALIQLSGSDLDIVDRLATITVVHLVGGRRARAHLDHPAGQHRLARAALGAPPGAGVPAGAAGGDVSRPARRRGA